jgi:hypothetical protein
MLHLLPERAPAPAPKPYAEAVSRLASVRHALSLVDAFAGGPATEPANDEDVATVWERAEDARRRAFDRRSEQLVSAAAAGLEALLAARQNGREPHSAANQMLVDQIRRELADVARVIVD